LERSLLADGVQIEPKCKITRSILGQRLCVQQGAVLDHAILFGATRYEEKQQIPEGKPALGVGEGSVLRNCIIDKDVRIGKNVTIEGALGLPNHDDPNGLYYIREGLVILPRKAVIPDGMKIPAQ
jgi:glucose-1-phosphate adenylyltransferase